jgi:hypothetical protein
MLVNAVICLSRLAKTLTFNKNWFDITPAGSTYQITLNR